MKAWQWNLLFAAGLLCLFVSVAEARLNGHSGPPFRCLALGTLTVDLHAAEPGGWWAGAPVEGEERCIPRAGAVAPFATMAVAFSIADENRRSGLFIVQKDDVITSLTKLKAQLQRSGWRETGGSWEASRRLAELEMASFKRQNEWMDVIVLTRGGASDAFVIATGGIEDEP